MTGFSKRKKVGRPKGSKDQVPRKRQPKMVPPPTPADLLADLRRRALAAQSTEEAILIHKMILKLERAANPPKPRAVAVAYEDTEAAEDARVRRIEAQTARTEAKQAAYAAAQGAPIAHKPPTQAAVQQARADDVRVEVTDPMDTIDADRHKVEAAQADKQDKQDKQVDPQTAAIVAATLNPQPVPTYNFDGKDILSERNQQTIARVRARMAENLNEGVCDYNTDRMCSVKDLFERESDIPEYVAPETVREHSFTGFPEGRG
jgi:hypothetical protein